MDLGTSVAVALGGAAVGWAIRGGFEQKPEEPICKCVCALNGPITPEPGSAGLSSFWILFLFLAGILTVVVSNVALAFKFSYKDASGEQEPRVGVKGKSKGVYGASLGLALSR